MPALKNKRIEAFARAIASLVPADCAFIEAGLRPSLPLLTAHDADALARDPVVAGRIQELRAEFADRALIYAEYLQLRRQRRRRKNGHA